LGFGILVAGSARKSKRGIYNFVFLEGKIRIMDG
jgi:hypothetical protein